MAGRFREADLRHQAQIDVDVPALKLDCSPGVGELDLLRSAVGEQFTDSALAAHCADQRGGASQLGKELLDLGKHSYLRSGYSLVLPFRTPHSDLVYIPAASHIDGL